MQTETYLVAIGALLLALILRPAPVVIVQRDRDESSIVGWIFGLVLIVGGAIWLLGKTGCTETSTKEKDATPEKASSPVHINEAPRSAQDKSQDTFINTAPPGREAMTKMINEYGRVEEEDDEPLEPRLAVFLRSYQDYDSAELLQTHFSQRDISIFDAPNGGYWAVIEVNNKKDGKEEIRDWNRHKGNWSHMELEMRIIDLNDP